MGLAVGHDQLVDGVHQLLLVVTVEVLEDLEAADLELGLHHLGDFLVARHRLGVHVRNLLVGGIEHAEETAGVGFAQALARRRGQVGRPGFDPVLDQAAYIVADEFLFLAVEVAVDVAEGRQVKDDRMHLLFGHQGIIAEAQHGAAMIAEFPG
jgi:hypothetical protein